MASNLLCVLFLNCTSIHDRRTTKRSDFVTLVSPSRTKKTCSPCGTHAPLLSDTTTTTTVFGRTQSPVTRFAAKAVPKTRARSTSLVLLFQRVETNCQMPYFIRQILRNLVRCVCARQQTLKLLCDLQETEKIITPTNPPMITDRLT